MHTSLEAIVKFALPSAPSKYLSFDYQLVATFTLHVRQFKDLKAESLPKFVATS